MAAAPSVQDKRGTRETWLALFLSFRLIQSYSVVQIGLGLTKQPKLGPRCVLPRLAEVRRKGPMTHPVHPGAHRPAPQRLLWFSFSFIFFFNLSQVLMWSRLA